MYNKHVFTKHSNSINGSINFLLFCLRKTFEYELKTKATASTALHLLTGVFISLYLVNQNQKLFDEKSVDHVSGLSLNVENIKTHWIFGFGLQIRINNNLVELSNKNWHWLHEKQQQTDYISFSFTQFPIRGYLIRIGVRHFISRRIIVTIKIEK